MPIIGLTGGYASGKGTVAKQLKELGAYIIDLDVVARKVVLPGSEALDEIVQEFGRSVITSDGRLDRAAMANIVFNDRDKRKALESILHPPIREAAFSDAKKILNNDPGKIVVIEAPLLFEGGLYKEMDKMILVALDVDKQIDRGMTRDSISHEEAEKRIAAQWSFERKLELADYVIDNNKAPEVTAKQVENVWRSIRQNV